MEEEDLIGVFVEGIAPEVSIVDIPGNFEPFATLRNKGIEVSKVLVDLLSAPVEGEAEALRAVESDKGREAATGAARILAGFADVLTLEDAQAVLRAAGFEAEAPKEDVPATPSIETFPEEAQVQLRAAKEQIDAHKLLEVSREKRIADLEAKADHVEAIKRAREDFPEFTFDQDGLAKALRAIDSHEDTKELVAPLLAALHEQIKSGDLFGEVARGASRDPKSPGNVERFEGLLNEKAAEIVVRGAAKDHTAAFTIACSENPDLYAGLQKAQQGA